jgi:uncharacterized membrane protein YiaA
LTIDAPVLVIPFTVTVDVLAVDALETLLTASEVEETPFTFEVSVLPERLKSLVVPAEIAGDKSKAVLETPFTVVVKLVPVNEVVFELTIGAPVLVIPFTVTVDVLAVDAFETPLTASEVEVTPFTFEVSVFPERLKSLVIPAEIAGDKSKAVLETPFIVVVKLVPVNEVVFELTIGAPVLVIPFTVTVDVLAVDAFETPLTASEVEVTPFTFEVRIFPERLNSLVVPAEIAGDKSKAVLEIPFTVVVNEAVFELTIGAPILVIPFTVTVDVLAVDAFETPLTASEVEVTPFTFEVNVFPERLNSLVVPAEIAGDKSKAVLETPFIVVVKLVPVNEVVFELTIGAPILVIPFTVTVDVLAVDALETPLTASEVEVTPFTFEVNVLPERLKSLVVPAEIAGDKSKAVLETPFTVVVRFVPVKEEALELMIDAPVLVIPFTVIVDVLAVDAFETPLTASEVEVTPFTFEVNVLPERLKSLVVPAEIAGDKSKAVLETPFTVVVRFVPVKEVVFELTIGAPVLVTPFTVTVDVLAVDALETVVEFTGSAAISNIAPPSVPT